MKKKSIILFLAVAVVSSAKAQTGDTLAYNPNLLQACNTITSSNLDNNAFLFNSNSNEGLMQSAAPEKRHFSFKQSFQRNVTYAGLVFIADGLIIKAQKKDFRSIKTFFQPHFKETYDNYTQYAPLAATFALKALGVKNTSSWGRLTLNSAMSYIVMTAIVNSIKYSAKEMRPDNSTANSFPSGHTATAFTAATIFHKEYGHLSPWYTVAGYGVASLTGITRIMNNRHWISDVLVGAGIGIVSTDLGYMIGDLILRGKGVQHPGKNLIPDISEDASFFSMSVGTGVGPKHLNAPEIYDYSTETGNGNAMGLSLKAGRSTSVNIEGAYFFNKYLGVGARVKASSLPLAVDDNVMNKNFKYSVITGGDSETKAMNNMFALQGLESSHLGMIDMSVGVYGSLPIGSRLRIGTKFLIGNRLTTNYSVDAIFSIDPSHTEKYTYTDDNGKSVTATMTGKQVIDALDGILGTPDVANLSKDQYLTDNSGDGKSYYRDNDFLTIKANNTITLGTGLSLTYAMKDNIAFKFDVDYDYAAPKYTFVLHNRIVQNVNVEDTFVRRTSMNNFSFNLGMSVCL